MISRPLTHPGRRRARDHEGKGCGWQDQLERWRHTGLGVLEPPLELCSLGADGGGKVVNGLEQRTRAAVPVLREPRGPSGVLPPGYTAPRPSPPQAGDQPCLLSGPSFFHGAPPFLVGFDGTVSQAPHVLDTSRVSFQPQAFSVGPWGNPVTAV